MKNQHSIRWIVASATVFLAQGMPTGAFAEDTPTINDQNGSVEKPAKPVLATAENTADRCKDNEDNDLDGHADCDDQDCEVFAVCVAEPADTAQAASGEVQTHIETPAASITLYRSADIPELNRRCSDGIDNNGNGLADCRETSCQRSFYCRKEMYEYPKGGNRIPGLFINFGFGAALPNYRSPRATADSIYGNNIPFDPDLGAMVDLQVGYLFFKWFGAGVNFKTAVTYASNEFAHSAGGDEDYKYWGYKYWGNVGGFARFQWPIERIVPYVNIHLGYSAARNRWNVYDDTNRWDDIWEHESDHTYPIEGTRDEQYSGPMRHFTFALEPGIDFFVAKRLAGIGIKAWLPVVASGESETDNVGVMLSFIFTPTWRGAPVLKDKYKSAPKAL